jgi:hypothetical protein
MPDLVCNERVNQHLSDLDAKRDMQGVAERVVSPLWWLLHDPALRRLA